MVLVIQVLASQRAVEDSLQDKLKESNQLVRQFLSSKDDTSFGNFV